MTETEARPLPMTRPEGCPFDPPPELRERRPLDRLAYPDGHVGWLVTGHALARRVLADNRFSSRSELLHIPYPGGLGEKLPPAPPGHLHATDPPEHTRYRQLLTGKFTVRRMALLTARIEQITADHLDAMAKQGPVVDLVESFAYPIPALTICELLGVPAADHEKFQHEARMMNALDVAPEEVYASFVAIDKYVRELVTAKRAEPTDDLLSDLAATDLTEEELAGIGTVLLGAGLDTTANMLALGSLALLTHPDQLSALRDDPAGVDGAVEELLRYLTVVHTNAKTALEDVELDGHLVKAGDTVTISLHAANRDPDRFPEPDTLDLSRRAVGHVAFGHGIHQCLGQQLARVEMRAAFPELLKRFPTLRLAVPAEEIPVHISAVYSAPKIPVTWDGA